MKNQTEKDAGRAGYRHVQMPARSSVQPAQKRVRGETVLDWVKAFAVAIALAVLVRVFVLEFQKVEGPSMLPTLQSGETIFINKLAYVLGQPERGEIIICHFPGSGETYVKRVVGLPGETVEVRGGVVYIDGEAGKDSYEGERKAVDSAPVQIPKESVYVMGDNRNSSFDSSDPLVGPIPISQVMGRVQAVVWPLDQAKGLYRSG